MRKSVTLISILLFLFAAHGTIQAQELPPRPLQVTTFQNLSFGAFINGIGGGTVEIKPEGSRVSSGAVVLVYMNQQYYPAIFEVEALPGNIIHVGLPVFTSLSGPEGNIPMEITSSLPESPFVNSINPPFKTQVRIGGILTIDSSIPAGNYFGTFSITFIQE